ncbi:MAG: hypothetical protein HYT75_00290 [Deltaproteobacteria bacterium]|nr:hypothetical protein [Deltaproteobacteria bacterium]
MGGGIVVYGAEFDNVTVCLESPLGSRKIGFTRGDVILIDPQDDTKCFSLNELKTAYDSICKIAAFQICPIASKGLAKVREILDEKKAAAANAIPLLPIEGSMSTYRIGYDGK